MFFGNESYLEYSELLSYISTNSHFAFQNISSGEKFKIWRECNKIFSLHGKLRRVNTELSLEPMTDISLVVRTSKRSKVKKSVTRKTHLEKSKSSSNRKNSISNFHQTNPKDRLKKIEISRSRRSVQTRKEDSSLRLKVRFSLNTAEKVNGNNEEFLRHLTYQLAKRMRVPIPCIQDLKLISGTTVTFNLTSFNDENNSMDDESVFEAADFLKMKIKDQQLILTDLNGQLLMTTSNAYVSTEDTTFDFSIVILIVLCLTLLMIVMLIVAIVYISRRLSRISKESPPSRNRAYRNMDFGRDSSQSIGKYSYDSGLWIGPGPEPAFTVPDAPFYRPPTVDQIASTPRPVTAVRTRLKTNWDVDERALSTIPDDHGISAIPRRGQRH